MGDRVIAVGDAFGVGNARRHMSRARRVCEGHLVCNVRRSAHKALPTIAPVALVAASLDGCSGGRPMARPRA